MESKNKKDILVVGAGIAGINAAIKLAESGINVYLCEQKPSIGGTLFQLDKWFPDNHCGMCQDLLSLNKQSYSRSCLRQGLFHPRIMVLLNSDIEEVTGEAGNFQVRLNTRFSGVKENLCNGCGICEQICPVEVANEFKPGAANHKAIYLPNPLSLKKHYVIDKNICSRCGKCVDRCPSHAIDLDLPDKSSWIKISDIILSTGFEKFDPLPATEFGYKRYPNVITNLELERLLSAGGPKRGILTRPSDGKMPQSIAFLQCVGSRTRKRDFCSVTCCMMAIKEAVMIKEVSPETEVKIYYMDIRDFGKGHYDYHLQAEMKYGIKFIHGRIPVVKQDFRKNDLLLTSVDENNKIVENRFGMVVLSVGQTPSSGFKNLCARLGLKTNKFDFCTTTSFDPVATSRKGIYVCGSASGPKDIADALIESTAAAGEVTGVTPHEDATQETMPGIEVEPGVGILICDCGKQLSEIMNLARLSDYCKSLPAVKQVEEFTNLCQTQTLGKITENLRRKGVERFILVGCAGLRSAASSLNGMVEVVDIREQLAWVHQNEGQAATRKAMQMVHMACEKLTRQEARSTQAETFYRRALIVGGGLAGLTAALKIAEKGIETVLVEKAGRFGGNAVKIFSTLNGDNTADHLGQLINKVESNPLIHLHLETELVRLSGYSGCFRCTLQDKTGVMEEIEAGAITLATGGQEFRTSEYLYGQSEKVITQLELEDGLNTRNIDPGKIKSAVMVQCVGSRCNERAYCSRICCSQALKNALLMKERHPGTEITIFYRDLMAYGFQEQFYSLAREKGIRFLRYYPENKPVISIEDKRIKLKALDTALSEKIDLEPDLVILSPAILPSESNTALAKMMNIELTAGWLL